MMVEYIKREIKYIEEMMKIEEEELTRQLNQKELNYEFINLLKGKLDGLLEGHDSLNAVLCTLMLQTMGQNA